MGIGTYPQIVDVDADGNADVLPTFGVASPGLAFLFRGDGEGTFSLAEDLFPDHATAAGTASLGVRGADLNGDGVIDLLRGSPTSNINEQASTSSWPTREVKPSSRSDCSHASSYRNN